MNLANVSCVRKNPLHPLSTENVDSYRPHPKDGGGGGYPSQVQTGGTPARSDRGYLRWGTPWQGWCTPCQVRMGGTTARSEKGTQGGVSPGRDGVSPARSVWGVPQPGLTGGGTLGRDPPGRDRVPPRYRTADGVLDTPRSVCLLRSRRRTV